MQTANREVSLKQKLEQMSKEEFVTNVSGRIIGMYEEEFDLEYGPIPEIVLADLEKRKSLIRRAGKAVGASKEDIDQKCHYAHIPMYLQPLHIILMPDDCLDNEKYLGFYIEVLAHELAHALVSNYESDLITLGAQDLETPFVINAIVEGHADCLSIGVLKKSEFKEVREGAMESEQFKRKGIHSRKFDKEIEKLLTDDRLTVDNVQNLVYRIPYDNVCFIGEPERRGYLYVSNQVNQSRDVFDCLRNPPTLKELLTTTQV